MRILAIDMGTGTQDILVFDSDKPVENNVKMVLPSATEIAARRIRRAARERHDLLLTGVVAGGGPCSWALEEFLKAGGRAFATPEAAQTFNDDLDRVRETGVVIISDDEARGLDAERIVLRDLDLDAVRAALSAFEEPGDFDGLALGCLDHGAAPPDVSDRLFRFEHLRRTVEQRNDLLAFASRGDALAGYLTRGRSMVASRSSSSPAPGTRRRSMRAQRIAAVRVNEPASAAVAPSTTTKTSCSPPLRLIDTSVSTTPGPPESALSWQRVGVELQLTAGPAIRFAVRS